MVEGLEARCLLAVITVDTTADADTRDSALSLREAIEVSNGTLAVSGLSAAEQAQVVGALGTPNTIAFNIPGSGVQTIFPGSALPTITSSVIIDGFTQPGSHPNGLASGFDAVPLIQISGLSRIVRWPLEDSVAPVGLTVAASNSTIRGLVVNRYTGAQVSLSGNNNTIQGSILGLDPTGTTFQFAAASHVGTGVSVSGSSNTIGGTDAASRNLISGNAAGEIRISGDGNAVQGNLIGPGINGTQKVTGMPVTTGDAVRVTGANNTIGGTAPGAGNVISADTILVHLDGTAATGNRVQSNRIGVLPTGTSAVFGTRVGVWISNGAHDNTIGGTAAGAGNLIAAVGGDVVGAGIDLEGAGTANNLIQGNTVTSGVPYGIWLGTGASNNTIGGAAAGAGNTIVNSGSFGVVVSNNTVDNIIGGTPASLSTGNTIRGNSISGHANLGINLTGGTEDSNRVTANSAGGPHVGPNFLQNYPVLQSANASGGVTTIAGTLNSTPGAAFTLDFYASTSASSSGYGEGQFYLGSLAGVTTDASGNASFSFPAPGNAGNQFISATATDAGGNTSEFSLALKATGTSQSASTTTLASSANPSTSGQPVTFTATVSGPGGRTPTGTVTFTVDGVARAPVALTAVGSSGQATLTDASLAAGDHTVTASYSGDAFFAASTSAPLTQTVVTHIGLDPLPAITPAGSAITVTATVVQAQGDLVTPLPGALVTFTVVAGPDLGKTGSATTGPDGKASFTFTSSTTPGRETISASFVDGQGFTETAGAVSTQLRATPTLSWAMPAAITYGTPLGSAQLDATADVPGTFAYTPGPAMILHAGAGQVLSATFTPADTTAYSPATITTTIDVLKATPVLTWGQPSAMTYGTPLGTEQLDALANVPGSFAYTPPAGTVLQVGTDQLLSATFTPDNASDYESATVTTTIDVVVKATPTLSWAKPSAIVYGTPLGSAQLNATADVPGTFAYTPAAGTVLNAGAGQVLSATFTPTDTAAYTSATITTTIDVTPAPLTIGVVDDTKVYGQPNPSFVPTFSGFVPGQGPGALDGTLTFATTATTASHVGQYAVTPGGLTSSNYAISFVPGTLTVIPTMLTIVADASTRRIGLAGPPLTATYAGLVNGDTPADLATPLTLSTTATASSPVGTYPITASGAADPDYTITFIGSTLTITAAVAGDYNGDGKADLALYRRNNPATPPQALWFLRGVAASGIPYGSTTLDVPVPADYDGLGKMQLAVYRPSTAQWFIQGHAGSVQFGSAALHDIPVPADYDGDGRVDIAVFRPSTAQWFIRGNPTPIQFGSSSLNDQPIPADYDGDGKVDIAVFRPSTAQWFLRGRPQGIQFGSAALNDLPVPGDYAGTGGAQLAVYRPTTGQYFVQGVGAFAVGQAGDIPVPGDYDGTGRLQPAVFRRSTGQWIVLGHAAPVQFGGPSDVPVPAPYPYRALDGGLSVRVAGGASSRSAATARVATVATPPASGRRPAQTAAVHPVGPLRRRF